MSQMNDLPPVALGAWAWGSGAAGGDQVFGNHFTAADFRSVFAEAVKCGLNLWDTAAVYGMGASEEILGSFLQERPRDSFMISTKFTPQIANLGVSAEEAAQQMLDGSKKRLRVDCADIYWIHNPADVQRWTPGLIPLAKSGQIKFIGVSNHNLTEIRNAAEILGKAGLKIAAVQNHYSLLNRSSETAGILDYCRENGIVFFAYMVLEQGALSGKYDAAHPFPAGSDRAKCYGGSLARLGELVQAMKETGTKYGASPAQIAEAWAIAKGTLPLIGVTKSAQVKEAAAAAKIRLQPDEIVWMEDLADKIGVSTIREWEKEM